jgi:hypothetical protein
MPADLIAKFSDIDLKYCDAGGLQGVLMSLFEA